VDEHGQRTPARPGAFAVTGVYVAVALLLVQGVMSVLQGVAAVAHDEIFVQVGDYAYKFSLTAWGWTQLVLGVLMFATGLGLLRGSAWARIAGIVLVSLNIIEAFLFIPYQPGWAVVVIAIGAFLLWSLCLAGNDELR
jgi:hypothetical protein